MRLTMLFFFIGPPLPRCSLELAAVFMSAHPYRRESRTKQFTSF
jgi:hypothetical protein